MPRTHHDIRAVSAGTTHVTRVRNTCRPKAQYQRRIPIPCSSEPLRDEVLEDLGCYNRKQDGEQPQRMTLKGWTSTR